MKAILSGAFYLPKDHPDIALVNKSLSVKVYNAGTEETEVVKAWTTSKKGYIGLPRQDGLNMYEHLLDYKDKTSNGGKLGKCSRINLRDYQEPWVEGLVQKRDTYDTVAEAFTGSGKTIMALEAIRRLGRTALIIVDQDFLRDQWIASITDKKFLNIPRDRVGIIQGSECSYVGKDIVVAMIQTLHRREYPKELYDYFGILCIDENHCAGAPVFSKVLFQFSAKFRFGISATPERTDALHKVIDWNLGGVGVRLQKQHRASKVRYLVHDNPFSWYSNTSPKVGRYLTEISEDPSRNLLIAGAIKELYLKGRDILAVSDRIEQLEGLMSLCYYMGIPVEDMGVVAGFRHVRKYAREPHPKRRPVGYVKGSEYTPVSLQLLRKRNTKEFLTDLKDSRRIIFTTYGMFEKGVDVPRLSAGIECTPRSKARQVHGRILRDVGGKKVPVWVTIRDKNSYRAEHQFVLRIDEYLKSNAEISEWRLGLGVRRVDAKQLKTKARERSAALRKKEIATRVDGSFTVTTRNIVKR